MNDACLKSVLSTLSDDLRDEIVSGCNEVSHIYQALDYINIKYRKILDCDNL